MWFSWVHVLAGLAITINALSALSVVMRLTRLQKPRAERQAVASVILPITGPVPDLETVVRLLGAQTLPPRRLIVAVESTADPAYRRAHEVMGEAPFPVEVAVAGEATRQAQKCRNQQQALTRIDATDEAIVLMDGDIRPQRWWLSALVSPVADGTADIVTGHRWQQVARHRLGAHLVTAIDRGVTLLPRTGSGLTSVVWGGSMALSPQGAGKMNLTGALDRTLSDDLSIAEQATASGLRVLTRGALLVPSPGGLGLAAAWRFGVRQYRIGHIYRPWLWRLALVAVTLRLTAWIVVLSLAASGDALAAIAAAALAGFAMLKQYLVGEVARRLDMPDPASVRFVQLLLGPLQVLVDLFHASVVLAAASTRRITWGHVVYEIAGPDSVAVKERLPFPAS